MLLKVLEHINVRKSVTGFRLHNLKWDDINIECHKSM